MNGRFTENWESRSSGRNWLTQARRLDRVTASNGLKAEQCR